MTQPTRSSRSRWAPWWAYLVPVLAVNYLRQSARTLAGTAVIRPLDAVTTKPETASTVEIRVSTRLSGRVGWSWSP